MTGFWRAEASALLVRVKVQPKSRRPGLEGLRIALDGPRLRVAVAEAPEDGRANRAVCAALAKALGLPASAVEIAQGLAARDKTLRVSGDPVLLIPKIEALA
ncbi:MAG: DUF167 domain-containing protein [Roseomonas sp.]|nr:DUF167 domain-containing protein [Roseomonas sp.]MCA3326865.1 DUF167 domain-containing protein [Roseomonas sp.]MCA3331738.1 DUF167 domain-containing protein [Roseomonas sp.]MCA3333315.1 DUF167 domain-containing protein [Roseomonas sp.]MCA3346047.1 DUF167 domain-containing protein [Roseomonas sp.]